MNIYDPAAPPTEKRVQRPDRIVWNKDGSIDIVDYKFAAKSSDHDTQVRRYMNLLQRIYPDKTINGFLWYADNHNTPAHVQPVSR
jgi:RecB family endonuclease NucS